MSGLLTTGLGKTGGHDSPVLDIQLQSTMLGASIKLQWASGSLCCCCTHAGLSQERQSHRGHPISYPSIEEDNEADCYLVDICLWAAMRLLSLV